LGCGEVKCPYSIENCDFESYVKKKTACLEKLDNGVFQLKRHHNYYYQVQQQLFTTERRHCDFVVCAFDISVKAVIMQERIYPNNKHWEVVLPKLEAFWRICILPEIIGRWYTRKCVLPASKPLGNGICFCRMARDETSIPCSNHECPYVKFHMSCLCLDTEAVLPKSGIALIAEDYQNSRPRKNLVFSNKPGCFTL